MSEKTKLLREEAEEEKTSSKRYGSVSYKYTLIDSVPRTHFTKKQCILVSVALLIVIIAFAVTLSLGLPKLREKRAQYLRGQFITSDAEELVFESSAIVADGEPCARIGKDILSLNGSVVDVAIAMLFCDEIANPQSSGIGGGFFMIFYNRTSKKSEVIDARETAPMNLDLNLVNNNATLMEQDGPWIAVPGQLKGMLEAHRRYGRLNWTSLVEPSIELAINGIVVNHYLEKVLLESEQSILNEESLKEIFVNNGTGKLYKRGEVIKRPKLAQTLQRIASDPQDFYNGSIANDLIEDIKRLGGVMTLEDLNNYEVKVRQPLNVSIHDGDYTFLTVPPPASGAIVALVLNILDSYNMTCSQEVDINERILGFHRFVESMKFAFAQRLQLEDLDFTNNSLAINEIISQSFAQSLQQKIKDKVQPSSYYGLDGEQINDEGTGHISVVGPNGDAVSVTSSINSILGSKRISQSTGIILNDEIKDFVINTNGQTTVNQLAAGKRPMSSMSPSILIDREGNTKVVIGGVGGTRIMSAVSQVLYQSLWKCHSLKSATDTSRLYYDINTNNVLYEADFPKVYIDGLYHFGHLLEVDRKISSVYTIMETNSTLHTLVDHRKGGSSEGL